ncbi:hypothetical protein DAPPUDRAFT_314549 [Daphnia pulex]|uniref:Uncharacterized protein n=1 Tax=Daphnia pulex TaxID=6669 RepID=E9G6I8_DAPPU|nr:hypothetical protein DAPPUDRAFT_314549 [Daphnia pulex]|eukprot:EFX84943.1 hypothetical protein DAPPUDRAFT_314549 [Daphnia pulex]
MSFNKHSVRLFVMQRNTSHQIAPGIANYRKYDTRLHQGRYLSTEVLPEEEQSGLFGKKLNERQRAAREKFLEAEKEWDRKVKWDSLNEDEIEIVKAHKRAVLNGHFTYDDTKLGKKVTTRLRHFLRGSCCGNGCRHCIYNHVNVPEELKGAKTFNSAFWA